MTREARLEYNRIRKREQYRVRKEAGLCIQCGVPNGGYLRCKRCKDADQVRALAFSKKSYRQLKAEVFEAYGNICACCKIADPRFLTVDHIYNDGAEHRTSLGGKNGRGRSRDTLKYLKDNGFPKDRFQLLCWNCNCAKAHNGGICPHQQDQVKVLTA